MGISNVEQLAELIAMTLKDLPAGAFQASSPPDSIYTEMDRLFPPSRCTMGRRVRNAIRRIGRRLWPWVLVRRSRLETLEYGSEYDGW